MIIRYIQALFMNIGTSRRETTAKPQTARADGGIGAVEPGLRALPGGGAGEEEATDGAATRGARASAPHGTDDRGGAGGRPRWKHRRVHPRGDRFRGGPG